MTRQLEPSPSFVASFVRWAARSGDRLRRKIIPPLEDKIASERKRALLKTHQSLDRLVKAVKNPEQARAKINKHRDMTLPDTWCGLVDEDRCSAAEDHRKLLSEVQKKARSYPLGDFRSEWSPLKSYEERLVKDIAQAKDAASAEQRSEVDNIISAQAAKLGKAIADLKRAASGDETAKSTDVRAAMNEANAAFKQEFPIGLDAEQSSELEAELERSSVDLKTSELERYHALIKARGVEFATGEQKLLEAAYWRQKFDPISIIKVFEQGDAVPLEKFEPLYLSQELHLKDQLLNNLDLIADEEGAFFYKTRSFADGGGFEFERNWFVKKGSFRKAFESQSIEQET